MIPVNKKFKTMSRSMTELVGLVGRAPWDEGNAFRTRPSSPKSPSFERQPVAKKPKVVGLPPSTATINNIFLQQIKHSPAKEDQILSQYKKEKSPTLLMNKHYHRIGLRERLARKSLTFDEEWNRKEAVRREEHIIKRAETILETKSELTNTLCLEILDLSDETFHTLLLSHPKMSIQSASILITTAWAKNAEGELQTVKRRKFSSLARLCILPRLLEQIEQLRSVLPSYQKLLAIDHDVVIENILFPFMQLQLSLPKPLLEGVRTQGLMRMTIDWLYTADVRLSDVLTSNLLILLNNEPEYFVEPAGSKFLHILQDAVRTQPHDIHVVSLFNYVVRKYIHNFKEHEIKFLEAINDQNGTLLKGSIAKLLSSRTRRSSVSEPMETDSI